MVESAVLVLWQLKDLSSTFKAQHKNGSTWFKKFGSLHFTMKIRGFKNGMCFSEGYLRYLYKGRTFQVLYYQFKFHTGFWNCSRKIIKERREMINIAVFWLIQVTFSVFSYQKLLKWYRKSPICSLLDVFGMNVDGLKLFEQLDIMCIFWSSTVCIQ